jgi:cytochrome b subunit of formate dehydrogenase
MILLVTGLCLYLPSLSELVSRRPLLKGIHIWTAVGWAIALVVIFLFGDRGALRRTAREIDRFDADDRAWLRHRRGTPQGRLNAGQKLNAIVTAAFALLVVHDWLMYVSFFLFVGHLYLSLIYPKTRHALSGITRGWVDEGWALEHHRKWAEQARER